MKIWNQIKVAGIFLRLVRNPNRTDLIFKGVDIFSKDPDQGPAQDVERTVLAHGDFRTMFEANYVPETPSMEQLSRCPRGSFGEALYRHMNDNHLDFTLFPRLSSRRPIHYLSTRIYQDHDLWHTLLGYGVSVEDELAIQAFGVAQFRSPVGILLIAGGLLHLLSRQPQRAIDAFQNIVNTYELGQRAPFWLAIRLHDHFHQPIGEVRKLCGMTGLSSTT